MGVFPAFDFSFFLSHILWLTVFFSCLYFFMERMILPRIGGIIEMRRERIAADMDQAFRMKSEADNLIIAYEKVLSDAQEHGTTIVCRAVDKAKATAEAERFKTQSLFRRDLLEAEEHISVLSDKLMHHLDIMATELASDILVKLIDTSVNQARLQEAVQKRSGISL
jgi:F-type H+-transporting ATPase subunit b